MMSSFTHELSTRLVTLRCTSARTIADEWAVLEETFRYITALEHALGAAEVARIQGALKGRG